jgi:hypothetical protein
VVDQNAVRAAPRYADDGPAIGCMLGGLPLSHTAIPEPKQDAPSSEAIAQDDPTTESQRLVFDEIAESADLLESYAIGLREAARRDDRDRVHAYLGDIARQFISARDAYNRIRELAKLGGRP